MDMDEAFLQSIIENPDDDAPRLIYADWLEEHGEAARAEFIRIQVEIARLSQNHPPIRVEIAWLSQNDQPIARREEELLCIYKHVWRGALPDWVIDFWFRRGFVEGVRL